MPSASVTPSGRWGPRVAALVATLVLGSSASAQLTVENLIGQAVSTANREYPDVEDAIQRFGNKDVEAARTYLERAKKKHPKLPPTDVTLAKMFVAYNDGTRARLLLERAVAENPDDPEAYLIFADEAFKSNRLTESEALFEKADRLTQQFNDNAKRKQNFEIRVLAGDAAVAQRRGQWQTAEESLRKWIAIDGDNAVAHQRLGATLFQLGKTGEAYEAFAKARQARDDFAHPYVALAQLFAAKGETEKARENYEKAYAAESDNDSTAQAYATWLLQQREIGKDQEVASRLLQKNPESEIALLMTGVIAQLQGEREKAEDAFNKLLTDDPANAKATNLLALLLIESPKVSDQEKALRHAQVNAERFPKNPQTQITLAWVQHKLDRVAEANAALQRGTQAGNLNADSGYLVARILSDRGKKEQALRILQEMLKRADASFLYRHDAEELYKQLGGNLNDVTADGQAGLNVEAQP